MELDRSKLQSREDLAHDVLDLLTAHEKAKKSYTDSSLNRKMLWEEYKYMLKKVTESCTSILFLHENPTL